MMLHIPDVLTPGQVAAMPLRTVPPLFNSDPGGEHHGAHVDGPGPGFDLDANVLVSKLHKLGDMRCE